MPVGKVERKSSVEIGFDLLENLGKTLITLDVIIVHGAILRLQGDRWVSASVFAARLAEAAKGSCVKDSDGRLRPSQPLGENGVGKLIGMTTEKDFLHVGRKSG